MRRNNNFILMAVTFQLILFSMACERSGNSESENRGRVLEFNSTVNFMNVSSDTVATIRATIADDNTSRSAGLMNVYDMPQDAGMLFIFPDEQPRSFWMSNTPLSLDLIFVDNEMTIVRIQRNAQPYSDDQIVSELPARYVIETHSGFTINNDITEGMTVAYERSE